MSTRQAPARDYLTLADVLAIHEDQVAVYSSATGVHDPGQLETSLFRPQSGYYADLMEEAAALWESQSQNQPFVIDNKRTAFASKFTFLASNGTDLIDNADETWAFMSKLYETGSFGFDALEPWLRANTSPA